MPGSYSWVEPSRWSIIQISGMRGRLLQCNCVVSRARPVSRSRRGKGDSFNEQLLQRYRLFLTTTEGAGTGTKLAARTINTYLASLRAFCTWLKRTNQIPYHPMKEVKGLKLAKRFVRDSLTEAEVARLMDTFDLTRIDPAAQERIWCDYAMTLLWVSTGTRSIELRGRNGGISRSAMAIRSCIRIAKAAMRRNSRWCWLPGCWRPSRPMDGYMTPDTIRGGPGGAVPWTAPRVSALWLAAGAGEIPLHAAQCGRASWLSALGRRGHSNHDAGPSAAGRPRSAAQS